jgi:hypothetical protein
MRDLKAAGVQPHHLSESEPSLRRTRGARCQGPRKPALLPVTRGRKEGRAVGTQASSLPGEGPSLLGRGNGDTVSPKRHGNVTREGRRACRGSHSNRKARCRGTGGDAGEGKTPSQWQGGWRGRADRRSGRRRCLQTVGLRPVRTEPTSARAVDTGGIGGARGAERPRQRPE